MYYDCNLRLFSFLRKTKKYFLLQSLQELICEYGYIIIGFSYLEGAELWGEFSLFAIFVFYELV